MAGRIEARLTELGIALPEPVAPLAAYVPFVQTGNLVFVSGQLPAGADGIMTGHLTEADHGGDSGQLAHATAAARLCALNVLAQVKAAVGDLDRVTRIVKLTGFVNCDGTFSQHPQVINGASELMADIFADAGQHARAAVGSSSLPLGAITEVEAVVEVS